MLAPKIAKYINHKLILATKSSYYRSPELAPALNWAYSLNNYLKSNANNLSDFETANLLKNSLHFLQKLLPCPQNKSFESSRANCEQIKIEITKILTPNTTKHYV